MIYNISDRPPIGKLIAFAIQMLLSVFVATALIAQICGVAMSGALVGAGCATLIYILTTQGRSPMFISNSGAFVAPVLIALAAGGYTAVAVGGLTTCIVYCLFGLIFSKTPVDNVYKVFPKSLIGAVTVVIGINLMPFILTYVQIDGATNMWGVSAALLTLAATALVSHYAKGMWKILPFLVGVLVGYVYAIILTLTGLCQMIDFSIFSNLSLFSMPTFAFTLIEPVAWSVLVPIIVVYIAYTISAMMECLSDHAALGGIIGVDLYRNPGLGRIFCGEGLANLFSACVGGLGACSYGESVACIGFSKVASVWVTGLASIFLIILGFLAPVQAFIASIPSCVFAGSAVILYGFIACSGVKMLQHVDLNIQKNLIIVSVVLSLGISGIAIGGATFSLSATALALVVGIILNFILRDKKVDVEENI